MTRTQIQKKTLWAFMLCGIVAGSVYALAQQAGAASDGKSPDPVAQTTSQALASDHKISDVEAKQLFRSVDEILKFASEETGLPRHNKVKRRLVSRDEVVSYIQKHMEQDEDSQRMQRNSLVLKKFGLLPQDFDLKTFLVAVLREQVAGYYDPRTKTVNLLDWVDVEQQKPVLAHELTHALQDQNFNIEKWMKAGNQEDLLKVVNPTSDDFANDEAGEARQAVAEGQATVALIDYGLLPFGQSMTSSPKLLEAMKEGMRVGTADSPQFKNAPLFLREALTFPYSYGLDFVGRVILVRGKPGAVDLFRNPPTTTRQIMEPQTYLSGETLPPMPVPDFTGLLKGYEKVDVGGFGEFDTAMLVDQFEGVEAGRQIYPEWRGGYYFAVKPKTKPDGPLGLLYVSRWASAAKAEEFAAIYGRSIAKRYHQADPVAQPHMEPLEQLEELKCVTRRHSWNTEEGPVEMDVCGNIVVVTESFDNPTPWSDAVLSAARGKIQK
jgi:hypothetical protein